MDEQRLAQLSYGVNPLTTIVGPAINLPNLPSFVAELYRKNVSMNPKPGFIESMRSDMLQNAATGVDQFAQRMAGLDPAVPRILKEDGSIDWTSAALELGPSSLMPMGTVKAPQAATRLGRAGQTIAETAVNSILPGVQGTYKVQAPVQAGLTAGLTAAIPHLNMDEPTQEEPFSFDAAPVEEPFSFASTEEPFAFDEPAGEQPFVLDESPNKNSNLKIVGAGLAGLGMIAGGAMIGKRLANERSALRRSSAEFEGAKPFTAGEEAKSQLAAPNYGPQSLIGDVQAASDPVNTSVGGIAKTGLFDQSAPIVEAAQKHIGGAAADDLIDDLRTTAASMPLMSRIEASTNTGAFVKSRVQTVPVRNVLAEYTTLDPQRQALLNDGLIARAKLDDLEIANEQVWPGRTRNYSRQDLANSWAQVQADPQLRALAEKVHKFYRDSLDYQHELGVIDAATKADRQKRKHYVSLRTKHEKGNPLDTVFDTHMEGLASNPFYTRERDVLHGVVPGEIASPVELMMEYMSKQTRFVETNRLRRKTIKTLEAQNILDKDGNPYIERIQQPHNKRGEVSFLENGKLQTYLVRDSALADALQFTPHNATNIITGATRLAQSFATGTKSIFQVTTAPFYESIMAGLIAPKGKQLGIVGKVLNDLTSGRVNIAGYDPSVLLSPFLGAGRTMYGKFMEAASLSTDIALRDRTSLLSKVLDPQQLQDLNHVMSQAYVNSTYHSMQKHGAINSPWLESVTGMDTPEAMLNIIPQLAKQSANTSLGQRMAMNSFIRGWKGFVESMAGGMRTEFYALNKQDAIANGQLQQLAALTRSLTGDTSRIGGNPNTQLGKKMQLFIKQMMYGNVMLQTTARHAEAIKNDPRGYFLRASGMVSGAFGMHAMASALNPELVSWYWNDASAEDRAQSVPTPLGLVPVPAEMRMFWSPIVEGYGAMMGMYDDPTRTQLIRPMLNAFAPDFEISDYEMENVKQGWKSATKAFMPNFFGPFVQVSQKTAAYLTNKMAGKEVLPIANLAFPQESYLQGGPQVSAMLEERTQQPSMGMEYIRGVMDDLLTAASAPLFDSAAAYMNSKQAGVPFADSLANASNMLLAKGQQQLEKSVWGGLVDLEMRKTLGTAEYENMLKAQKNVTAIMKRYADQVEKPNMLGTGEVNPYEMSSARDTEFAVIGGMSKGLMTTASSELQKKLAAINETRKAFIRTPAYADKKARITQENQFTQQRQDAVREFFVLKEDAERAISEKIGRRFSYEEYEIPYGDATAPSPELPAQ